MKVEIKDLQVTMMLGNNGIELDVRDNQNRHLGDLRIGKAKIEWCSGQTQTGNGNKTNWQALIAFLEQQPV